jgi:hypothetical protein
MAMPPSILMQWPVIYSADLSSARYLTSPATSSAVPNRPAGMFFVTSATISSGNSGGGGAQGDGRAHEGCSQMREGTMGDSCEGEGARCVWRAAAME